MGSPLATFKEKDNDAKENDESVGENIKMAVYEQLATFGKEYQIINFENEEPTEELRNGINYIHFQVMLMLIGEDLYQNKT